MVNLYVKKIKEGTFEYKKVPKLWKKRVLQEFKEELENGEITQEEYEMYISEE